MPSIDSETLLKEARALAGTMRALARERARAALPAGGEGSELLHHADALQHYADTSDVSQAFLNELSTGYDLALRALDQQARRVKGGARRHVWRRFGRLLSPAAYRTDVYILTTLLAAKLREHQAKLQRLSLAMLAAAPTPRADETPADETPADEAPAVEDAAVQPTAAGFAPPAAAPSEAFAQRHFFRRHRGEQR